MIALLQRVSRASVSVDGQLIGAIDAGILALIGVSADDNAPEARRLVERMLGYRLFEEVGPDGHPRMNLSLAQTGGGLLLVPQFTLAADTRSGTRASFTTAAAPERAGALFGQVVAQAEMLHPGGPGRVAQGRFGAHMELALVNDGPVTFWLET
ncbi:MAG: D-aminoacyl-tRNA deacylase [Steroidobacteraceae bacterium]